MRYLIHLICVLAWVCCVSSILYGQTAHPQSGYPAEDWTIIEPTQVGLDSTKLERASQRALEAEGAGMIVRHGLLVHHWGDIHRRYDLKSTSKSIGVTALGLALADGKLSLDDRARKYHPSLGVPPAENDKNGWRELITIGHLATQTAGFAKPGGYQPLLFEPGTAWYYSDGGPNWLAECITKLYQRDVQELLFDRVFNSMDITRDDLRWRENQYREHDMDGIKRREFGSGVHANVDAMARIGLLYLRRGKWRDKQLLPASFVDRASHADPNVSQLAVFVAPGDTPRHGNASQHYGLLWWNNADGALPNVPKDAFWSWGLYDSLILVIPSLDMVASRTGKSWDRESSSGHYEVLAPFFEAIVDAVVEPKAEPDTVGRAPYPPSDHIVDVQWQNASEILRLADGSDNWPITWMDDDSMLTAYGDGWGFEPKVEKKLSLGLAKVHGTPLNRQQLRCENLRSASIEQIGQGAQGRKASGLLCVGGVVYMWVRNADNAQLAWSEDHGANWEWCDWKFESSFGCPTFLNAGKNYADAPDDYAYIYSPDSETAYAPADRMVLARVPTDKLRDESAYEFFTGTSTDGEVLWSLSLEDREGVLQHPARCYRGGVTYSPALKRYLWCQTLPESQDNRGPRFEGGFGIYESPKPWGPWRTVFFTEHWDVGPGETSCLPSKWMSVDGTEACLLFSGNDCFSVRRLRMKLN